MIAPGAKIGSQHIDTFLAF